jgi:hypothetical protein
MKVEVGFPNEVLLVQAPVELHPAFVSVNEGASDILEVDIGPGQVLKQLDQLGCLAPFDEPRAEISGVAHALILQIDAVFLKAQFSVPRNDLTCLIS